MYNARGAAPPQRGSILGSLKATEMLDIKPALPAEIISKIIDYLPVSDQICFARTSRKYREMVYDDTRWVPRLVSLGCWNEAEARRRFEEAVRRRREALERANKANAAQNPSRSRQQHATTLFDAAEEEERTRSPTPNRLSTVTDGFETMSIGPPPAHAAGPPSDPMSDPDALLDVIKNARSIRGFARQEYGKIYGALAPFYFDMVKAKSHTDPIVFKLFRDPERQAKMLSNLHTFARSDWASGWREREEKLTTMSGLFEGAVLREFEQGYELWDVDGRMRRFAGVLETLNGGNSSQELFIHRHPLLTDPTVNANPTECLRRGQEGDIDVEPSRLFFETLGRKVNEQSNVIWKVFPRPAEVFWAFLDKVREDTISEYVNVLFDETHDRNIASYLKAVSGIFEQAVLFVRSLEAPKDPNEPTEQDQPDAPVKPKKPGLSSRQKEFLLKIFEPHLDLYLQEELDFFTKHAETEVAEWDKKLSEQDATVEDFYMSNFQRQAEKKDFLSSFKKVVMMPVTVLPVFGTSTTSKGSQQPHTSATNGSTSNTLTPNISRSATPSVAPGFERQGTPLPEKAPTDELAAKAQLMASRLEGIKSLFSLEMALNLVHTGKSSLGRAAVFIQLGGQMGEEAREQCAAVFVNLLRILGSGHIKPGFEKAIGHLGHYKAREVSDHSESSGVAPLVMFIELVNVGDLISQMIDVFYEQQVAQPKIADKNDFLDPSGLAKKKFEQMLDESVAAGMNKGIDVLMDEVEYLCATLQKPTDYNPTGGGPNGSGGLPDKRASTLSVTMAPPAVVMDLGPTETAKRIVELVSGHTGMLVGSTDKSMLDVFNGEVGLRLFTALCKHLKRQRVSTDGAVKLIADMNLYFEFVRKFKNPDLLAYFRALRELSQIYLIDPGHAKEMATIIADTRRFSGVFRAEEVYEFAERRADWYQVKKDVERAMYGLECSVM